MRVSACIFWSLCAAGCLGAPDEVAVGGGMTSWEVVAWAPGDTRLESETVALVARARSSVRLAADTFTSIAVADALVAAQARGVDVQVVGDVDRRDQAGFVRAIERLQPVDGGLPVRFGDGAMIYNPNLTTVERDGAHSQMTSNFVVVDELQVVSVSAGFGPSDLHQVGFRATSDLIARDAADEFAQMYAGIFASTVDDFSAPVKSITDNREVYEALSGRLGVYFGPQERTQKRVIDAVYAARASVLIVAEELASAELAAALRYKAEAGFRVDVVVGPAARAGAYSRVAWLEGAIAGLENASLSDLQTLGFTGALIDRLPSPIDGSVGAWEAFYLTQPFLSATATVGGTQVVSRAADAFTDSTMFAVSRAPTDARHGTAEEALAFDRVLAEASR